MIAGEIGEFESLVISTPFLAGLPARVIDENPSHCFGCCPKEVPSAVPMLAVVAVNQPQIRLMYQRSRLQRLPWFFQSQPLGGEFAKLFVNERQQLVGGRRVALLNLSQDLCDIAHDRTRREKRSNRQSSSSDVPVL